MTTTPVARDDVSAPFFDATARGELLVRRCEPHGHLSAPRCVQCPQCGSTRLGWAAATGRASLVTWTVVHQRAPKGEEPPAPTVAGIVELVEGPWIHVRLVDVDPGRLAAGTAWTVDFERVGDGEVVPVFRPAVEGTP